MPARSVVLAVVIGAVAATPARAELPGPVRAMIESAMRTDDARAVAAVIKAAKETQPQDGAEIDAMKQKFDDTHTLVSAERAKIERDRVLAARPLQLWKGEGEIGAFRSTGNTESLGISAGLKLERQGVYWQHKLQFNGDYQKTSGVVSREQYLASYSPRYQLDPKLYIYGLTQYERDRFQGYRNRYSLSPGLGYKLYDRKDLKFSFEGGPAVRFTDYIGQPSETTASALGSFDFAWSPSPTIKVTQVASAYLESDNSTFTSTTGIEAGMTKGLKARITYRYEHDSDPPDASRRTDTLSRFTLVYGF